MRESSTLIDIKPNKSRNLKKLHEKYGESEAVESIVNRLKFDGNRDAGDISGIVDLVKNESNLLKSNFQALKEAKKKMQQHSLRHRKNTLQIMNLVEQQKVMPN